MLESIWIEIFVKKGKSFLFCSTFRPPDSSLYTQADYNLKLKDMLVSVNSLNIETIIMGDFNVNYLNKNDHHAIKEIFNVQSFQQLITMPTRTTIDSETLIDLIFTNNTKFIARKNVFAIAILRS